MARRRARRARARAGRRAVQHPGCCTPTTTSSGRISACKPTEDAASHTTRASSTSSGSSRAAPCTTGAALPLATDDPRALRARRGRRTRSSGVSLADACPQPAERCYPLGGRAFHLLGDARARVNWSAPNTSYVERDAEDGCAASTITRRSCTRRSVGPVDATLRRDYRELVPALRHRYEPDHPAVAALRKQARATCRLTIDAGLQLRVATIVAAYAQEVPRAGPRRSCSIRTPATCWRARATLAVLARAPARWRSGTTRQSAARSRALRTVSARIDVQAGDRRGGAAQDDEPPHTTFTCVRLPDGRVGAKMHRLDRPIRDECWIRIRTGRSTCTSGMVHSCNAYFAQLAREARTEAAGRHRGAGWASR